MSEAIEGRWCGAQRRSRPGLKGPGNRALATCGGELFYLRRLEGERIVTYLACRFCGSRTAVLAYDREARNHTDLTREPA